MATRQAEDSKYQGVVVQSFVIEDDAVIAIRDLQAAGFTADEISVVAKDKDVARGVAEDTGTQAEEGAAVGLVAGGVLGGVVAALAGASAVALPGVGWVIGGTLLGVLVGGAAGAITGGLIGMGIPEREAEHYNERYKQGDVLVTVVAGAREPEARRILQRESTTDFSSGYDRALRSGDTSRDMDADMSLPSGSSRLGDMDASTRTGTARDVGSMPASRDTAATDQNHPG